MIERLEAMLASGRDSALLRFSLGTEHAKIGSHEQAIEHLHQAVAQNPDYAAAWKLLGQILSESGEIDSALEAYDKGIAAAQSSGAQQAAKEMQVFKRRLEKRRSAAD